MKRQLKFRGKTCKGNWVYGDLLHIYGGTVISYDRPAEDFERTNLPLEENVVIRLYEECVSVVYPNTVTQYTGLKDKNGVEIYEGDIISYNLGATFVPKTDNIRNEVYWEPKYYGFYQRSIKADGSRSFGYSLSVSENKEIVGNIFDNPEILKGGEK